MIEPTVPVPATVRGKRRRNAGFTLIELLIVIAILGVLSVVVVFAVGGISDNSQNSACDADLKTVEVAVEAYRAENGTYPTAITQLVPGFLRRVSDLHEVGGGGTATAASTITPIAGEACA